MKILCFIDSLGSGGAQRQIVNLACGLKARGHQVELLIYHPNQNFLRSTLDNAGIPIIHVEGVSGFSCKVIRVLSHMLKRKNFNALISFLPSANVYAILAKVFSNSQVNLIVGERASRASDPNFFRSLILRCLYFFATNVAVNSHHQANYLKSFFWLRKKVTTIYNGYSIDTNMSSGNDLICKDVYKLLVIGRVDIGKNGVRLVKALILFYQRNGYVPSLSWVGRQEYDQSSLSMRTEMEQLISSHLPLGGMWHWLGERMDISQLLSSSDALVLVSLYEGLPNVICEAFIAARPVIASNVCDNPILVKDNVRGLLCDPLSPESICTAIERFVALSPVDRQAMGHNARQYAEKYLTLNRMVNDYEALLN